MIEFRPKQSFWRLNQWELYKEWRRLSFSRNGMFSQTLNRSKTLKFSIAVALMGNIVELRRNSWPPIFFAEYKLMKSFNILVENFSPFVHKYSSITVMYTLLLLLFQFIFGWNFFLFNFLSQFLWSHNINFDTIYFLI